MRNRLTLGTLVGVAALTSLAAERDAQACGGCIPPPTENESVITDEKMILSISQDQTTLYDEIKYSGAPSSFAWVLPIKGTVTVGLSADVLFSTLDSLTATLVQQPVPNCPVTNCGNLSVPGAAPVNGVGGSKSSTQGGVTVLSQKQVGPYETVQLRSTDGSALENWLSSHGYTLPAADQPVVAAYVAQKFDFLALKLIPGEGVSTMQPVRVTSQGASISLPLHMVAVGTGATTGITIWVVADGRWEPQNFPTFTISDSELSWDWTTSSSNYESLRLSKEAALGGRGWQIESSLELNQPSFQESLLSTIEYGGSPDGLYTTSTSGAGDGGVTEGGSAEDGGAGGADGGADASAQEDQAATTDLAVLFAGIQGPNFRVTRMRSDVAHSALSADMFLQASADQSEMTNLHTPVTQIGQPPCYTCSGTLIGEGGIEGGDGSGAGGSSGGSHGCNTTGSLDDTSTRLAGVFAALGFVGLRVARRRKKAA
jgi:MYXO-CTERM domain-containing protein